VKTIVLLTPIKHNGKNCEAGEVLEVTELQAKRLISLGVARLKDDAVNNTPQSPQDTTNSSDSTGAKEYRDPEQMNMNELRVELDLLGVTHKSNMSKLELLNLYLDNKPKEVGNE